MVAHDLCTHTTVQSDYTRLLHTLASNQKRTKLYMSSEYYTVQNPINQQAGARTNICVLKTHISVKRKQDNTHVLFKSRQHNHIIYSTLVCITTKLIDNTKKKKRKGKINSACHGISNRLNHVFADDLYEFFFTFLAFAIYACH